MLLLRERPELKILIIEKAAAFSRRVDRKSTRLNSSHSQISYAVFCLKKKREHPYASVYHEYTHLITGRAHEWLPLWLNEGWAEFYDNTEIKANEVLLGEPRTENVLLL